MPKVQKNTLEIIIENFVMILFSDKCGLPKPKKYVIVVKQVKVCHQVIQTGVHLWTRGVDRSKPTATVYPPIKVARQVLQLQAFYSNN